MWSEDRIKECLALWRADLKAMDNGTYVAPLPHVVMTDCRFEPLNGLSKVERRRINQRNWRARRRLANG